MKSLKFLIISGFFEEKYGYQEIHIANTLARLGHTVKVLTSNKSQFGKEKLTDTQKRDYEIIRLKSVFRIIDTIFPIKKYRRYIDNFNPDVVFLMTVSKGLPYFSIKYLNKNAKILSFFGDLYRQHASFRRKLVTKLFKDRWYRKAFLISDLIVANTNETKEILITKSKLNNNIIRKIHRSTLGYDSKKFFFDSAIRENIRRQYGFSDVQIVFCTTTKIVERKPIVEWITPIINALKEKSDIVYCLAGFLGDVHSALMKKRIKELYSGKNLLLLDFMPHKELNRLYNACDYSVWFDASITIQESMATGLRAIIPESKTVDHLVDKDNGYIFKEIDELPQIIKSLPSQYNRSEVAKYNFKFSYESIIENLLLKLKEV